MKKEIIVQPSSNIQIITIDVPDLIINHTIIMQPGPQPTPPPPPQPISKYLSLPLSGVLTLSGKSDLIIENLRFDNTLEASLKIWDCRNITIKNCFFNKSAKEAIDIYESSGINIYDCLINGVETGVYALNSQGIKVNDNQFLNVRRRQGSSRGQFVQLNACSGAGNEILNNKGENFYGESDPEDLISLFSSSGTQASPIWIAGNVFRGGGPSDSGGGIMLGDRGGSYQLAENNKILDSGNYLIACAGGNNITIQNNQGYQSLKDWSNVGAYAYSTPKNIGCRNITFVNNNIFCNSKKHGLNHYFFPTDPSESCKNSKISGNISTITAAQLNIPEHLLDFVTPSELLSIRR